MRRSLLVVVALIALYAAWPYWSVWRLYSALNARDAAALAERVDWPNFRKNLKASLGERLRREGERITIGTSFGGMPGQLSFTLTPETIDQLVNRYGTPERLPEFFALEGLIRQYRPPAPAETAPRPPGPRGESRRVTWAFFASPFTFEVHMAVPQRPNERVVPVFQFQGIGWMLTNVRFVPRG